MNKLDNLRQETNASSLIGILMIVFHLLWMEFRSL